jgi:hypothetical protein
MRPTNHAHNDLYIYALRGGSQTGMGSKSPDESHGDQSTVSTILCRVGSSSGTKADLQCLCLQVRRMADQGGGQESTTARQKSKKVKTAAAAAAAARAVSSATATPNHRHSYLRRVGPISPPSCKRANALPTSQWRDRVMGKSTSPPSRMGWDGNSQMGETHPTSPPSREGHGRSVLDLRRIPSGRRASTIEWNAIIGPRRRRGSESRLVGGKEEEQRSQMLAV